MHHHIYSKIATSFDLLKGAKTKPEKHFFFFKTIIITFAFDHVPK